MMKASLKIFLSGALIVLLSTTALGGELYKWVDKNGEIHYSDSKAGAEASGVKAQEKNLSGTNYNVAPPPLYPPTPIVDVEEISKVKAENRTPNSEAKERAGDLPWFNESNFESEVLESRGVTLVEFWASWCGVCRRMDPILSDVARGYGSKARFGRIDVDEYNEPSQRYNVKGLPTFIIFKDGKALGKLVGGHSRDTLVKALLDSL